MQEDNKGNNTKETKPVKEETKPVKEENKPVKEETKPFKEENKPFKEENIKQTEKNTKNIEKIIYIVIVFMITLIGTAVFILFSESDSSTKQSSTSSSNSSTYAGSEMYILTLGELTEQEIETIRDKYKCDVVLTEDITNNKSYKLVFKKYISTDKITNIKEELKENGKIILVTIPANSI